jgi:ABC-type oligopeptide transport system substrate-binding subunit
VLAALTFGIGRNSEDYETWVARVRARGWLPDPQDLNNFLGLIFSSMDHDEIIKLMQ